MAHDFLPLAVPIELPALPVSACRHAGPDRMPESSVNVAVGIGIARTHAVDPVVQVRLAVVALGGRRQAAFITLRSYQARAPLLYRLLKTAIEIEMRRALLRNQEPARTSL